MNQTPNAERPTLNVEFSAGATISNTKRQRSYLLWRILDFVLAGVFIFAGLSKMFDLDQLVADLLHQVNTNAVCNNIRFHFSLPFG